MKCNDCGEPEYTNGFQGAFCRCDKKTHISKANRETEMTEECLACKNEQQHSEAYKSCQPCATKDNKLMEDESFIADAITMCTSTACSLRSSCVRFSYKEEDHVNMPQEDFFKKLGRSKLCPSYIGRILYEDN